MRMQESCLGNLKKRHPGSQQGFKVLMRGCVEDWRQVRFPLPLITTLQERGVPQDTMGLLILERVAKDVDASRLIEAPNTHADRLLWLYELLESPGYAEPNQAALAEPLVTFEFVPAVGSGTCRLRNAF